jgi:hypothetical protein
MGSHAALRNAPFTSNWTPPPGWRLRDGMPTTLTPDDPMNPRGRQNATGFDFQVPYVQQFNLTLQRELPMQLVASVSYVGSLGRKQFFPDLSPDLNQPAAGQSVRPLSALAPNVTAVQVYGPYSNTSYNALQATVERRFADGLGVLANYTWSHALDNFDYQPTANSNGGIDFVLAKGNSNLDLRHRFTLTANYELPFAKRGKGIAGAVAAGWQVNLIGQWQTSLPFSITNANPVAIPIGISNGTQDRPDQVGDPWRAGPVIANSDPACHTTISQGGRAPEKIGVREAWFNPCAFAPQKAGTWGNSYRNKFRGPQFVVFDFGLSRNFVLTEKINLQFTGQAFNLFNHVNFALPGNSLGGGGFGQIAGPARAYQPRNLQLALKLTF